MNEHTRIASCCCSRVDSGDNQLDNQWEPGTIRHLLLRMEQEAVHHELWL